MENENARHLFCVNNSSCCTETGQFFGIHWIAVQCVLTIRGNSLYQAFAIGFLLIETRLLKYNYVVIEVSRENWMVYKTSVRVFYITVFFKVRAYAVLFAGSNCCKTSDDLFC